MKVSNSVIVAVFLAFLVGFSSGAGSVFYWTYENGGAKEAGTSVARAYKFASDFISGEFDVNSESPSIQRQAESLMKGYTATLNTIAAELSDDETRIEVMSAFAGMMIMANATLSKIIEDIRSKNVLPHENPAAKKKIMGNNKNFI